MDYAVEFQNVVNWSDSLLHLCREWQMILITCYT